MLIITNNEKVQRIYAATYDVKFIAGSYEDVLIEVRNLVHQGHRLLTHPLSGSVKPNETPFKSVVVSKAADTLDLDSLSIIEHSITTCEKFMKMKRNDRGEMASEKMKEDFKEIDLGLLASALGTENVRK